jgi:hypothetical protein
VAKEFAKVYAKKVLSLDTIQFQARQFSTQAALPLSQTKVDCARKLMGY